MGSFTRLGCDFVTWSPLREVSAKALRLWLSLYTTRGAKTYPPGLFFGGVLTMADASGMAIPDTESCLRELEAAGLVTHDPEHKLTAMLQLPDRGEAPANPNVLRSFYRRWIYAPASAVKRGYLKLIQWLVAPQLDRECMAQAWADTFAPELEAELEAERAAAAAAAEGHSDGRAAPPAPAHVQCELPCELNPPSAEMTRFSETVSEPFPNPHGIGVSDQRSPCQGPAGPTDPEPGTTGVQDHDPRARVGAPEPADAAQRTAPAPPRAAAQPAPSLFGPGKEPSRQNKAARRRRGRQPLPFTVDAMLSTLDEASSGRVSSKTFDPRLASSLTSTIRALDEIGYGLADVKLAGEWVAAGGLAYRNDLGARWAATTGSLADAIGSARQWDSTGRMPLKTPGKGATVRVPQSTGGYARNVAIANEYGKACDELALAKKHPERFSPDELVAIEARHQRAHQLMYDPPVPGQGFGAKRAPRPAPAARTPERPPDVQRALDDYQRAACRVDMMQQNPDAFSADKLADAQARHAAARARLDELGMSPEVAEAA